MGTSPLPVKSITRHSWPLSSEGSYRATPTVTRDIHFSGHFEGPVTLTPVADRLVLKLSLPVF